MGLSLQGGIYHFTNALLSSVGLDHDLARVSWFVVPGPHIAQARASAAAGANNYGMLLPSSDLPCWPLKARTLSVAV